MLNFFSVLLIAVGLSMDTFTLSMSYGMLGINKENIIKISIMVGIFHYIMPLLGNKLGTLILSIISINPSIILGTIFLILSIQLIFSLIKKESMMEIDNLISMIFFSFTVSIDSFSVGLGLQAIKMNLFISSFIFMITSLIFTYFGMSFGNKIMKLIGDKAQLLGILLLISLAINYIIKGC